jgi:magnesium transporter
MKSIARSVRPVGITVNAFETAAQVRERLQRLPPSLARDKADIVCVVDEHQHLLGTLGLGELLSLPDAERPGDAAHRRTVTVNADADAKQVAALALHHRLPALPVLDAQGKLVGVLGTGALMHILRNEHVADLHRLAGMSRETDLARHAIEAPPLRRARHRLPWLIVGLVGSMVATLVVAQFEAALARQPAIAFFVPGLVYLADAIGTQSETVAVRGLSLSRVSIGHLIGNELRTGLLIGSVLALLAFPFVWWAFGDLRLAVAVVMSLAGASMVATVLGLWLPWLIGRVGLDPAYGSGPLATIVQDVVSLLIYFGCVSWVVLGA